MLKARVLLWQMPDGSDWTSPETRAEASLSLCENEFHRDRGESFKASSNPACPWLK